MQILKGFDISSYSKIKCPKNMIYHALTFSLSIVYISYFFVYLSALNFTAVVSMKSELRYLL